MSPSYCFCRCSVVVEVKKRVKRNPKKYFLGTFSGTCFATP